MDSDHKTMVQILDPLEGVVCKFPFSSAVFTVKTSQLYQLLKQNERLIEESKKAIAESQALRAEGRRIRQIAEFLSNERESLLTSLRTRSGQLSALEFRPADG